MIGKKTLLTSITIAIGISTLLSSSACATSQTKRLWGKDRYETCSAIVEAGWTGTSDYAIIVNGENFPDALSATSLAKKYNAPILLTQSNTLESNTYNQLKRLNVRNVLIVGGSSVITTNVENAIKNLGIKIIRYQGQNRIETSIKVAEQIGTENGVILATENDYTDALSAAPIAAKLQMPIILMPKDTVPDSVKKFLSGRNISKTYVLGGTDLISDSIINQFSNVIRISGNDKYERNINIIKTFSNSLDFKNTCVAYSEKFADALCGSSFAAINGAPIILLGDTPVEITRKFITDKVGQINNLYVFGGASGITDTEVNQLLGSNSSNNTDSDNSSINRNINEGNSTGNLRNGGFIVQKDDWLYYTKNGSNIYKIKTDGTQETKLADTKNCRSISITDGYVFYVTESQSESNVSSIFRMNLDGSNKTILNTSLEDSCGTTYPYIKVVGKWLFYSPNNKSLTTSNSIFYNELYKVDIYRAVSTKVSGYYFSSLDIADDYVYFTKSGDRKLHKMSIEGEHEEFIPGCEGSILYVLSNWIYYKDVDGNTYKVKTDGTSKTQIFSIPYNSIIVNNNVYFVSPGQDNLYELHKTNIDGTRDNILNAYKVGNFSILGDWMYYYSMGNSNLHRIKLDGSNRATFPNLLNIKSIEDIHVTIKQGNIYNLPRVVWAQMADDSAELYNVKWDTSILDTNRTGIYEFHGTVEGYSQGVKLIVQIN